MNGQKKWIFCALILVLCLLTACGGGTAEETGTVPADSVVEEEITDDPLPEIQDIGGLGDKMYGPPLLVTVQGAQDTAHTFYNGGTWKTDNGEDYPPAERYSILGGNIRNPLDPEVQGWVTDRETLTAEPDPVSSRKPNQAAVLFEAPAQPDAVTVRAWPDSAWGNLEAEAAEIPTAFGESWTFELNQGAWIYEIAASWNRLDTPECYEGTGYYTFVGEYRVPETDGETPQRGN